MPLNLITVEKLDFQCFTTFVEIHTSKVFALLLAIPENITHINN